MRLFSLFVVVVTLTVSGCNQDSPEDPTCGVPGFSAFANGDGDGIEFYVNSGTGNYGFFEVQYGANGFTLGNGTTITGASGTNINNLSNGAYDVYIRGNCGGNDWSEWSGPNSVLVTNGSSSNCGAPDNLNQYWSDYDFVLNWNGNFQDDYYEIEYGVSGFAQGTGTVETVNNSVFRNGVFAQGNTYDFYVRANCGGTDWSNWTGPASFYADQNANRCRKPLGILANRNGSYIEVTVQPDGESMHEVNFNNVNFNDSENIHTQNQSNGTYGTFSTNTDWYVWTRSVCDDGSKTAWTGPTVIN
ncbi:MAG: hypothetical protein ACPGU4_05145 [Flavobacteriales bacterium]